MAWPAPPEPEVVARRTLGPAGLAVARAVEVALEAADTELVVACSGGPDSLALAAGARLPARRRRLPLRAVVVDHGLQAGSAGVAADAVRALVGLGLSAEVRTVDVGTGGGPEAAARTARYAALRETAGAATVLLGHTLDDQAETVLLGLARGSGPRSLAGMAVRTGPWLRPLLAVRRSVTMAACRELGLTPWADPQNADPAYPRVRVRNTVLPMLEAELGPGVAEALARTAELCRADADALDALAAAADPGTEALACEGLVGLVSAVRSRVLRRWLLRRGAGGVGYAHLVEVDRLVTAWNGQRALDLPGVRVTREDGTLHCRPRS